MADHWFKDPDDTIVYKFDWAPLRNGTGSSDWLDSTTSPSETISSVALTIDSPGPSIDSHSITDGNSSVTLTISGGIANTDYGITCQVTTSTGQIVSRTAFLHVVNQ